MGLFGLHLPKKVDEVLGGIGRQVNPFDNGATFGNPTPPPRLPVINSPTNNFVTRGFSRVFDQVNPLDNGRTFQNPNPTNNRPIVAQLTHNAPTNLVGDFLVKPVAQTLNSTIIEPARQTVADITGNRAASMASDIREKQALQASLPGQVANVVVKSGDVLRRFPKQVMTDIHGFQGKAPTPEELANQQAGLRSFEQTPFGQITSPAQKAFAAAVPSSKPDLVAAGYDPNKSWGATALDTGMGALTAVGLAEGGASLAGKARPVIVRQAGSVLDTMRPPATANEAGFVQVGRTPKNIHPEDQAIMADFIDHARGVPRPANAPAPHNLELDASRIAEYYGIKPTGGKNVDPVTRLANAFDNRLQGEMQAQKGKIYNPLTRQWIEAPKGAEAGFVRVGRGAKTPETPVVGAKPPTVEPVKTGVLSDIKKGLSDQDQVILDQLHAIDKANPRPKGQLNRVQEFMYNSNMQRGSNAIANQRLTTSENISSAFGGMSKRDAKAFSDYANARTELASAKLKGRAVKGEVKVSRPTAELKAQVDAGHAQFGSRFEALNQHYKELANVWHDAGIIDDKTFKRYTKNNDYIRLQRDMGDLVPSPYMQGRGNSYQLGSTTAKQRRRGSSRATVDAANVTAERTQQVYREAAKNRTGTHLVDTLQEHGLAQKVSAKAAQNKNTVGIFRNGKKEFYEVPPSMKEAMDNINPYHLNVVMQVLAAPGRVLRAGVTGLNPVFIARNLVKDQFGSAINSEHMLATHNPKTFFQGLFNATAGAANVSKNPIYQDFLRHYGDQTSYDLTRNVKDTQQVMNRIRGGRKAGAVNVLKSPVRALENVASITEKSTRFQNYIGEYKRAIKKGLPPEEASQRAAIAAWQNSVDFSRAGQWGRVINTVIPYWNPATQGVRQMGRVLHNHPVKSVFAGTALVGLPIATATAWNMSNPDTKKIYDNIPEYEKDNNLILIPPGTKQNKDGTYDVVKVPLPPGYKDVFMPIRRALEAFHNKKPVEGTKIAQDILSAVGGPVQSQNAAQFGGSFIPQAVKPFVQQQANKDLFTGQKIVPDYMQQATDKNGNPIPESKKAYKTSSGTAVKVGDRFGVSPIRVEKFIKDTGGTVGLNLLNLSDNIFTPKQVGGQSVTKGFKRSFASTQGIVNENASPGAKYFKQVSEAQKGLNQNEIAAFNALHPSSKNFLGDKIYEHDATYDPAARLDVYNRFPKVFQADKKLDQYNRAQGKAGNPLYDLQDWQVKKVLEKENLPPGAKDPELSQLFNKEWYQNYRNSKTGFFSKLAAQAKADGKPFGAQDNPYPDTPAGLQKMMDSYDALPKGTGARSSWIKGNPGAWNAMQHQFALVDNWQNVARGKRGLDMTEGALGAASGYSSGSGGSRYGSSGSRKVFTGNETIKKYTFGGGIKQGSAGLSTGRVSVKAKPRSSGSGKISVRSSKLRLA